MRPPRMTTRRWMVAVAVVALIAWGIHRRNSFQRLAAWHRSQIFPPSPGLSVRISENSAPTTRRWWIGEDGNVWLSAQLLRENSWHTQMAEKYRRAARYPWLPVEPDPPKPEPPSE
jgi:hypothetical protein